MKLKFDAKTKEEKLAVQMFLSWLSNSGEQQYWESQRDAEYGEEGDVSIVSFDYRDGTVDCKLGRLTK